jgi:acyl carrier protein
MSQDEVIARARDFIVRTFLPGESPDSLKNDTPLVDGGILDSLGQVELLEFLEQQFGIEFRPGEVSPDRLNTLMLIAGLVDAKLTGVR